MNPYLEGRWSGVHTRLVTYTADALQESLPADLQVGLQERVFIESPAAVGRAFSPDVHVIERTPRSNGGRAGAASAVAEPLMITLRDTQVIEPYLEIIDAGTGGRVITAIEFVSRSNKAPGPGRDLYVQKQHDVRSAGVNLVEIDLLRDGQPVTLAEPDLVPPAQRAPYHVAVWRAARSVQLAYYPAPLRERLPRIAVPLRPTDSDLVLDLQAVLNECYVRGRYDRMDYTRPVSPPLDPEDQAWADATLRAAGLR